MSADRAQRFARPGPGTDLCEATRFAGKQLRQIRRSRGLTQHDLANLLGVAQPNISRWEAGIEAASPKCRGKLSNIFLNRRGDLDRFASRIARGDPDVIVFHVKGNETIFLQLGVNVMSRSHVDPGDLIGKDLDHYYCTKWRNKLFGEAEMGELALVRYHHDLFVKCVDGAIPTTRIYGSAFLLQLEGFGRILINPVHFGPPTGQSPVAETVVSMEDLLAA